LVATDFAKNAIVFWFDPDRLRIVALRIRHKLRLSPGYYNCVPIDVDAPDVVEPHESEMFESMTDANRHAVIVLQAMAKDLRDESVIMSCLAAKFRSKAGPRTG